MLQKLKEKIQKAVPEIMELKFGCEVEYHYEKNSCLCGILLGTQYDKMNKLRTDDKVKIQFEGVGNIERFHVEGKNWKILGRPITLEDVLLAIKKLDNVGIRMEYPEFKKRSQVLLEIWQLGKSLDEQTPELHKFLNDIILYETKKPSRQFRPRQTNERVRI